MLSAILSLLLSAVSLSQFAETAKEQIPQARPVAIWLRP
jgi:hypothetical protein